jgi:putative ABC transport system permease protein
MRRDSGLDVAHQRPLSWWADLAQDVRYGLRLLRRSPVFTSVALLTLALAIGANTAIFSLVNVLVLRDLPVRDPARLVQFIWQYPGDPPMAEPSDAQTYAQYRDHNTVFSDLIGLSPTRVASLATETAGETLGVEYVTGNFFPTLGVRSALGRLLGPEDEQPGAAPAAVVSWAYWKSRFNLDPRILGTGIVVQERPGAAPAEPSVSATVVGVADQDFRGLIVGYEPDVWIPAAAHPNREKVGLALFARLKAGATIARARVEMRVLDRPRIEDLARTDPQWLKVKVDVVSARAGLWTPLHEQFERPVLVLMGVVGVVLLLACANIGSLLLAQSAARQRELAVRISLGANRLRIVRQVLTESLLLSVAGSLLGIVGAGVAANVLVRTMTAATRAIGGLGAPRVDLTMDARVLLFTTAVTMLAAVVFSVAPAWAAFASAPTLALKGSAGVGQAHSRRLFGNGLVVAQVALSLVLVSVSQLYIAHLSDLRGRSLGFNRESVLLVSVDSAHSGRSRDQLNQLYVEALGRLRAIPGVRSATVSGLTPLSGAGASHFVTAEGFDEAQQARRRLSLNFVAPNYFATFGTPLMAGRDFQAADAGHPRVAIVNEAMARYYFAGVTPIGKHVWFDGESQPYGIVGLVGDAKYDNVRSPAPPTMYLYLLGPASEFSLRTTVPPAAVAGEVRRVLEDVLRTVPVKKVTTLAEQVDASVVPERLIATLSGFFSGLGLLLAAIGLYGLLAYLVARRTKEIGVRMALGATGRDVTGMVLRTAWRLVAAGLLVGAPAAFWSTRVAASMVENLSGGSPLPIAAAALAMIGVALLAAYVPARRATRVDPLVALRAE